MPKRSMKRRVNRALWRAENRLDNLRLSMRERLNPVDELLIQPYWGYGTREQATLMARVLEDRNIKSPTARDSWLDNIRATLKHVLTREMPGVKVTARCEGQVEECVSDEEGYVSFAFRFPDGSPLHQSAEHGKAWHNVTLESPSRIGQARVPDAESAILVPTGRARMGIISDIDDTVIRTGATSTFRMTRVTLLRNAHSRVPFEGAAAFYHALRRGARGDEENPLFYLSSSPWNLFRLLDDFLRIHGFPRGPIILRDLGLEEMQFFKSGHKSHKLAHVTTLLDTYPELPFVLIGDSGQKDAEIYHAAVKAYPERIRAVYIRCVSDPERGDLVREIAREVAALGSQLHLVNDSLEAAEHAARLGLIEEAALPSVGRQKEKDEERGGLES